MVMPGRKYPNTSNYRYGFNGKENDNEVKGEGNQQDYGFRIFDPRIGKFLSIDPLTKEYPWYSPYQFAGNKPVWAIDLDGAEEAYRNTANYQRSQALIRIERNSSIQASNTPHISAYDPSKVKWTSRWKNSDNILAKVSYGIVNGFYTTGQQLSSSATGQTQINNIGGGTYDSKGPFGEKQRNENFVNAATALVPAAPAENAATKAMSGILESKIVNRLLVKIETQVTEQSSLLAELAEQGIKYSTSDILKIGKNAAGKIIFLEKGNTKAGLEHILSHADEFTKVGIDKADIANTVFEAVTNGKQIGMQNSRPIYEVMYKGQTKNIAVTVGDNGYIVGANPTTKVK